MYTHCKQNIYVSIVSLVNNKMLCLILNICFRMPLSRAEVQRCYRERKKNREGEDYLAKERKRQQKYYTSVLQFSLSEKKKRNEEIKRVRKHRIARRLDRQPVIEREDNNDSISGYYSQESSSSCLVVRLPVRRNGTKTRLCRALETAKAKLKKVISDNIETKKKVRTLQKKVTETNNSKTENV